MTHVNYDYKRERIDPDKAGEWLKKRSPEQRPLNMIAARHYAQQMREGNWLDTGTPIVFDSEGFLINGQHRLMAIQLSGETQHAMVIRGMPREAFAYMDQGRGRSGSDIMSILGIKNATTASSIAGVLIHMKDHGSYEGSTIPNIRYKEFGEKYKDHLEWAAEWSKKANKFLPASVIGPIVFIGGLTYRQKAEQFCHRLATGLQMEPGSPEHALWRRIDREKNAAVRKSARPRFRTASTCPFVLTAWNAFATDKKLTNLVATDTLRVVGATGEWRNL